MRSKNKISLAVVLILIGNLYSFTLGEVSSNKANDNERVHNESIATNDQVKEWTDWLKTGDVFVRQEAASNLGKTNNPKSFEPLLMALKDPSAAVRLEAIRYLPKFKDKNVLPAFMEAMSKENKLNVGHALITAMHKMRITEKENNRLSEYTEVMVRNAKNYLQNENDDAKKIYVIANLVQFFHESPNPYEDLCVRIIDTKDNVAQKHVAIDILGKIGSEQAIQAIERAQSDKDETIKQKAQEILVKIKK